MTDPAQRFLLINGELRIRLTGNPFFIGYLSFFWIQLHSFGTSPIADSQSDVCPV